MIKLKIKKPGHTIAIPGLKPCRSPVDIDISKLDIRVIEMYLNTAGINDYEIIAESNKGVVEVYTQKDFKLKQKKKETDLGYKSEINKRFDRLEKVIFGLLSKKEVSKTPLEKEQITNQLKKLETLTKKILDTQSVRRVEPQDGMEPVIEEFDSFIPDIDISDMTLISSDVKVVEKDNEELEDAAEMLSKLGGGKKNG